MNDTIYSIYGTIKSGKFYRYVLILRLHLRDFSLQSKEIPDRLPENGNENRGLDV